MQFKEVIGHQEVKQRLVQMVTSNRLPHALLLSGVSGVGKLSLALALSRYVQCTQRTATDACGVCPSCRKHNIAQHPDMHYTFPVIKSARCDAYLPAWRKMILQPPYFEIQHWLVAMGAENAQAIIYGDEGRVIQQKLSKKAYESHYKVMLIWLPERMNAECSNRLLKLLEEPSPNTLLILVSNHPEQMLPTILSRCQTVAVAPLSQQEIATALEQNYHLTPEDALSVARVANGNYTKSVEIISLSEENQLFFDLFVQFMRQAYSRKIKEIRAWTEQVAKLGRERQKNLLAYMQRMVRENYIYNMQQPQLNYMSDQEMQFASRFAPFINERNIIKVIEELEIAERDIAGNANAKIVLLDLSISMILLLKNS